jgi:hypothetical protein
VRYDLTGFEWRVVEPGDHAWPLDRKFAHFLRGATSRSASLSTNMARGDEWNTTQHATCIVTKLGVHLSQAHYSAPTAARPLLEVISVGRAILAGLSEGFPRLHRAGEMAQTPCASP